MSKNKVTSLSENVAGAMSQCEISSELNEHKAWDVIIPRLGRELKKYTLEVRHEFKIFFVGTARI